MLLSHHLVISQPLLDELARVLATRFGARAEIVDGVLGLLHQDTTMAAVGSLPEVALDDEDDLVILATAIEGEAKVFVTGGEAVQAVGCAGGMKILSPRQFWEELVGQQEAGRRR